MNISNCGDLNVVKYIDNDESGTLNTGDNGSLVTGDRAGWSFTVAGPAGYNSGTGTCTGTTDADGKLTGCPLTGVPAGSYTVTENANTGKTIGTNSAPFFNTDPGPAPKTPPASKTASLSVSGTSTFNFGNSCYATATMSVSSVPAGTTGMFVRYSVNDATFTTTTDVAVPGTGTTRSVSVGSLRKGDVVRWKFGINNDANHLVGGSNITLAGYPSCAGSGTGAIQTATVSSFKYKDINADGDRDIPDGENGLQGFTFQLKSGATVVATTKSASDGTITFSNVTPGSYTIHETGPPTGWEQTQPAANGDVSVTVNLGDTAVTAGSFGNTPLSTIDVDFNSLASLLNGEGPASSTKATRATSISCTDKNGASVGSVTDTNSLTTSSMRLNKSQVTCVITFVDP